MGSCNLAQSGAVLTCTLTNIALLEPSYPPPAPGNMAPGAHTVYEGERVSITKPLFADDSDANGSSTEQLATNAGAVK